MILKGRKKLVSFLEFLAIVSILGFFTIFINSLIGIDISGWTDGLLFIALGVALMISGGIQFLFYYFRDGLDNEEITKVMTIIVGISSFIIGILTFPIPLFEKAQDIPVVDGVKVLVSILAITIIVVDTWIAKPKKK